MKVRNLLSYHVTRPFPYGKAFHWSVIIISLVSITTIFVWAAATAGYETVSILSPSYNMTDYNHWFYRFVPHALVTKQNGTLLAPGDAFQTTESILQYNLQGFFAANQSTEFPYENSALDYCDVALISLNTDVFKFSVTATVTVWCLPPWPASFSGTYIWSLDPTLSSLLSGPTTFTQLQQTASSGTVPASTAIVEGLDYLSFDLYDRVASLYQLSLNTTEASVSYFSLSFDSETVCPSANSTCALYDTQEPRFLLTDAFRGYNDSSFNLGLPHLAPNFIIPLSNLLQGLHSAVRIDIGSVRNNNIWTNPTAMNQYLFQIDNEIDVFGVHNVSLYGATNITHDAIYPVSTPGQTFIKNQYLCHIQQSKSPAGWIIAVFGLALSNFGSLWAASMILFTFLAKRKNERADYCIGHEHFHSQVTPYTVAAVPNASKGSIVGSGSSPV